MIATLDRLDADELTLSQIQLLQRVLEDGPSLLGREGEKVELPQPIFNLLFKALRELSRGNSVLLMPEEEVLSSQGAADILGVSRPFLISLTERGEIPCERVGRHRRIRLRDLREYQRQRGVARRALLDDVYQQIQDEGHYEERPADFEKPKERR